MAAICLGLNELTYDKDREIHGRKWTHASFQNHNLTMISCHKVQQNIK